MTEVPAPAKVPRFWRVSMSAPDPDRGGVSLVWLLLSLQGPQVLPTDKVKKRPCVYIVPEDDTPEEAERFDLMPRFKIISADRAILTGPQRDIKELGSTQDPYSGGPAVITRRQDDSRDFLQAYPAPVAEKFSSDHFKCYLWSPSREAALCVRPGGRVSWDANAPAKTVTNFGISGTVTVWTVERR